MSDKQAPKAGTHFAARSKRLTQKSNVQLNVGKRITEEKAKEQYAFTRLRLQELRKMDKKPKREKKCRTQKMQGGKQSNLSEKKLRFRSQESNIKGKKSQLEKKKHFLPCETNNK